MIVDTVDTKDSVAPPTSEPDAAANAKFAGEAGRIADSAGINGYDGIWHPADKIDGVDAGGTEAASGGDPGDNADDNASGDAAARPAAEASAARQTDTEPSTSAQTAPAER